MQSIDEVFWMNTTWCRWKGLCIAVSLYPIPTHDDLTDDSPQTPENNCYDPTLSRIPTIQFKMRVHRHLLHARAAALCASSQSCRMSRTSGTDMRTTSCILKVDINKTHDHATHASRQLHGLPLCLWMSGNSSCGVGTQCTVTCLLL